MKARYFLWFAVLFFFQTRLAAQGWIKGSVTEAESGQPIPGVMVLLEEHRGVTTDVSGHFFVKSEAPVSKLQFRFLGYKTVTKEVITNLEDTAKITVAMQLAVYDMDQVVVTASRLAQRMADLNVSMSVIKASQIEGRNITDSKDLINRSPGIEILDGQASVRGGSGFSYGAGSRVLALIDGLPVASPDAGNIRWQFLPLDNISQIEIIKGASSVVYGSSALNGVIHFRTADATSIPQTRAYLQTGIYDQPKRKEWKWWDSPRLQAAAGFNHLRKKGSSDFGLGFNVLTDRGYRKLNDEKTLRYQLKYKYYHTKMKGLNFGLSFHGGFTNKTDFVLWDNAQTGALMQDTSTAIGMEGSFVALDPFVVLKKSENIRHELRSRLQQSVNRFPESEQNNSTTRSVYTEYQLSWRLRHRINFQTGLSAQMAQVISNFHGDHQSRQAGIFAQLEFQTSERLQITGGFRLENHALDEQNKVTKPLLRAGLNFRLFEHSYLRASFGQGFRYPSIAERHASTTLGAVRIYPNFFIQPETGWSAEAGLRQGVGWRKWTGQVDLSVYYMQNKEMIEYLFGIYADVNGDFGFGFRAANIEAARVYGYEIEWMLHRQTAKYSHQLSGGYTYSYPAEFNLYNGKNTGDYLKYRRKHSLKINYDLTYSRLLAGATFTYRSKMLRIDDVFLNELTREGLLPGFYHYWQTQNKGHATIDLQLGWKLTQALKLSGVVRNFTNSEYMGRPGDIQPQRQYLLRLSGDF